MEEQRQRQEEETRRAQAASGAEAAAGGNVPTVKEEPSEEAMLERALAMSMESGEDANIRAPVVDFANMTEEEQIAFAMQMSMQDARELIMYKGYLG